MFTLHYAHLYYSLSPESIDFGEPAVTERPDYGDFAYLAFTIGMTYQVSDTALHGRQIRRSVLHQAVLSYWFGVVIVATGVSIIAGLLGSTPRRVMHPTAALSQEETHSMTRSRPSCTRRRSDRGSRRAARWQPPSPRW